ncbi:histidine--tRNA ligase [Gammaproteobacteria bacterium]
MPASLQAVRGMKDLLPSESSTWRFVEETLISVLERYGYAEIRTPILEKTDLFKRSIGEVTDIVEKEMYTFVDRGGDQLSLRPEGTAGCVRALVESGSLKNAALRLWYLGSMFRHERPQKGRYRQFHQIGVEAFGFSGPDIDAELILVSARMLRALGISNVQLEINSLGSAESRARYHSELVAYLSAHETDLDEDSRRRLVTNPLRILDSKNPQVQAIVANAPRLIDTLEDASRLHFETLCSILDAASLPYILNPRLVRGLDYYTRTVFEWVSNALGAQSTVCAGGRFDPLIEQLGGPPTPAIGFALGLERIVSLLEGQSLLNRSDPQVYLVHTGFASPALVLAERLRDALPRMRIEVDCGGGSLKAQFRRADKKGAKFAIILGNSELESNQVTLKDLRGNMPQQLVTQTDLPNFLKNCLAPTKEDGACE